MSSTPLLDKISSPHDLRKLEEKALEELCEELRYELVSTLSQVGGHFASSLGATEITVALHKAFETPHDRIVWDTGHQAYMHKILTGRRESLRQIRKYGGISGFPKRDESIYDTFGVAHAGTSISAALGMIEASNHEYPEQGDRKAIAVIGDGAMTSGMAFEALNHAGQLRRNLIVILNDNEMSIAPNVGALSWAFSKTVTGKLSTSARRHVKTLHEKGYLPHSFYRALDRAEEATQGFFSTPAMLFESFGFRYIGPVDGHNLGQLLEALERAKDQDGPVLIHALTTKGKGYTPAEEDPVTYHGVGPFEAKSGAMKKSSKPSARSYTKVFSQTLIEMCKQDPRVVGVTAAMPDGTGLLQLAREMPDRYFDVGIAEQHAVTFSAGLACEGMRPFCTIYSTFLQRAYDQVIHDVCIQSLPVVFTMDRGGLVGADGATHHGVFDIGFLRLLPNMTVMAPKDEAELQRMMATALANEDGPSAIRYPRGSGPGAELSSKIEPLPIGKGEVLREGGSGIALIGFGQTVEFCQQAASELETQYKINCSVVNARFVKPLDQRLFARLAKEHSLLISVEDHVIQGGFGSAILEFLSDAGLLSSSRLVRMGIDDQFIDHGTQQELYKLCGFDTEAIVSRVLEEVERQSGSKPPLSLNA